MNLNNEILQIFIQGMMNSKEQHAEEKTSYEFASNARLLSHNGKLAISSIKGTLPVYDNPNIVKYLGYYAFEDELVVFVKYDKKVVYETTTGTNVIISGQNITIDIPFGSSSHNFSSELTDNATEERISFVQPITDEKENPLQDNYEEVNQAETIDLTKFYSFGGTDIPNYQVCNRQGTTARPEYNKDYSDAILVLKPDGHLKLSGILLWNGYMNWDINRKITTEGVFENSYYKRVYFTDNLNPLRVVNLKDPRLPYRLTHEFDVRQETTMLQPEIKEINDTGAITSMSVQYAYRLITDNGQVTHFSPYSELKLIVIDDDGPDFIGGAVEERTSKAVIVRASILNTTYKEIQMIALEYEADTIPTSIRNLGVKDIAEIVDFIHAGTEPEFDEVFTLEDIIETTNSWTYCNDIVSDNNKLIAGGLRNKPLGLQEKYMQDLFLFKGYDVTGATHNSLINPTPSVYRFIDPTNTEESFYTKKQLYSRFLFFGNNTLSLINKNNPSATLSIDFTSNADKYVEYIDDVWEWLSGQDLTNFPNLQITRVNQAILFSPIDELIQTDFSDYIFETSISQVIIDFENEYELLTPTVDTNNLIYGAQSIGFNRGAGVRITFEEHKDILLQKSAELYTGGNLLELQTPSLEKTFVKDEIYRLSFQAFKDGSPLFAIPLGDIQVPAIGEVKRFIAEDGTPTILTETYINQSVEGDSLVAHRIEMRVEVRIPCEFKDTIDSYQIQYVERTENNRTVLAQGLSAPMVRVCGFRYPSESGEAYAPTVYNTWTLPFNGGPLYQINGLRTYDEEGEDWDGCKEIGDDWGNNSSEYDPQSEEKIKKREVVNRQLLYFDSPDIINGRISDKNIRNGKIEVLGRLNTDHTRNLVYSRFPGMLYHANYFLSGENETYKDASFSRKIGYDNLVGGENSKPYSVNVSIFSEFTYFNSVHEIDKTSGLMNKGQIIPGSVVGAGFEVNNSALSLFAQDAYTSSLWLSGSFHDNDGFLSTRNSQYASETGQSSNISEGYPSVIIRSEDDVFTDALVGPQRNNPVYVLSHTGEGNTKSIDIDDSLSSAGTPMTDTHALVNIKMNNEETIYGGRSKYAYSRNLFIPLGKVIPIEGSELTNQSQVFNVQGDFYLTLFCRTKNDFSNPLDFYTDHKKMHQDNNKNDNNSINDYNRGGAWGYGVILETEVESRLQHDYKFYRASGTIDFSIEINEILNSAYHKKNNLRRYAAIPYNFKDDPLMTNILSASETKLRGDYYDAWTRFLLNEFYELDKNKGIITNLASWKDEVFAIQETETNAVQIDTTDFITTDDGQNVAVNKGDGLTFKSHKKVSDFGTSIRRALAEGEFGFSFFDETNRAFVKFGQSLSLAREIEQKLHELFRYDKIIDTEGYYDVVYKETNIRIRTESGKAYMLSYNELLKVFNGWIAYNNDIYMMFAKRVFAPTCKTIQTYIECPVITSDDTITVQVNTYFEYQITATNDPEYFNAIDLPDGLQINTATGLIYGSIAIPGVYEISISAKNDACQDDITLVVTAVIDELVGVSNGVAIVVGTLTSDAFMQGVSNGIATVVGVIQKGTTKADVGSSDGSSTVTGTLTAIGSLIGSTNGVATVTGVLQHDLYGRINGISSVTGTVKQPYAFNDYVVTMEATNDCALIVRGNFTEYGGQSALKLAKIDTDGLIDLTFQNNIGTSTPDLVYSHMGAYVAEDGSIYLTGFFTQFNGQSANYIVKLNQDGTKNTQFNYGSGFSYFTTIPYIKETLTRGAYIPGIYANYKGVYTPRLAKIDNDGNLDLTFKAAMGSGADNTAIGALNFGPDQLLVHGYFSAWNGNGNINHLVVVNKDTGVVDTSFNAGSGPSPAGFGNAMHVEMDTQNGNKPILTGFFTTYRGVSRTRIARINRDGTLDTSYVVGTGVNNQYNGKTLDNGSSVIPALHYDSFLGKAVIGGHFDMYNGQSVPPMIRINNDGSLDTSFNYNLGDIGFVTNIEEIGGVYFATVALNAGVTENPDDAVYLVKVEKDGTANVVMNLEGDPEIVCTAEKAGYSYGSATVDGDLTVRPNDQIDDQLNGIATVSGTLTNAPIIAPIEGATGLYYPTEPTNLWIFGLGSGEWETQGQYFDAYPNDKLGRFSLWVERTGNPDQVFNAKIWHGNGPFFGTLMETSTNTVNASDISENGQWVHFYFPNVTSHAGQELYVGMSIDTDTVSDASNKIEAHQYQYDKYPTQKPFRDGSSLVKGTYDYVFDIGDISLGSSVTGTLINATP